MNRSYHEICEKLLELQTWGVPVELQYVMDMNAANPTLALAQTGNAVDNILFATRSGRVELIASLAISNISKCDILVSEIHLGLPFFIPDFNLIPIPTRAASQALPAIGPCPFEKSELLNARLGRRFLISSGLSVEGLLLAEGSGMVPKEYRHGVTAGVEVTVFANRGRRYATWLSLRVERQDQARTPNNRVGRRRLFEPDERDELNVRDVRCSRLAQK
jgi:hypothetical protein